MRARWNVLVQVFDEATGEVLEEQRVHNIVTTVGLTEIGRRVALIAPPGKTSSQWATATRHRH